MPPQPVPDPEKKTPLPQQPQWRTLLPYLFVGFLLLWIWQDIFLAMSIQTIPYSEFKGHLARGEVTKCSIREDQIDGEIVPKHAVKEKPPATKPTKTVAPSPAPSHNTPAPDSNAAKTPESAKIAKPSGGKSSSETKTVAASAASKPQTEPFSFHTIRVEDPQLVAELEAHGVEFAGERPSIFTSILLNWMLPLAFVFLLWTFL